MSAAKTHTRRPIYFLGALSVLLTIALIVVVTVFLVKPPKCIAEATCASSISCEHPEKSLVPKCPMHFLEDEERKKNKDGSFKGELRNITEPKLVIKAMEPCEFTANNFRIYEDEYGYGEDYHISGSRQMSYSELKAMSVELKRNKKIQEIVVVDTKREPHGFVNGESFYYRCNSNSMSTFLTDEEAAKEECFRLHELNNMKKEPFEAWNKKTGARTTMVTPQCVKSEELACKELGMEYLRLYVPDYSTPRPEDIDKFIDYVKSKNLKETHFHIHCNAGKGRTTTFLAIFDMFVRVSSKIGGPTFADIVKFHKENDGADLLKIQKEAYKNIPQQFRTNLLRVFYNYQSRDGKLANGTEGSFTEYYKEVRVTYPDFVMLGDNAYFANKKTGKYLDDDAKDVPFSPTLASVDADIKNLLLPKC